MLNVSRIALRLREQMQGFLGKLSLPKTASRFVLEAVYGIQTRQSLRLTEIARALGEPIPLIKTVNRLSRQAARPGLAEQLTRFVIKEGASRIGERTLLVIDPSDLSKKYARKMEHLARVRDGSTGEIANGYWLCDVIAVECGGNAITPLAQHLWSQKAPDFVSENEEILGLVDNVSQACGGRGVWVMDRGGDRIKLLKPLIDRDLDFIIRQRGDRHLLYRGRPVLARELAASCPLPYAETVKRVNPDGSETARIIEFGYRKVKLPGTQRPLWLLVVVGFGKEPMMSLTTLPLRKNRATLWWVVEAYLSRWRIEETIRFSKQSYAIEDVRVLGYQSLRNLMALVLVAMFFGMVHLGTQTKLSVLCHHAMRAGKRLFGVPDFRYYTIADGIREILGRSQVRPFPPPAPERPKSAQLDLLDLVDT
jgi:hypothetical protein